MNTAAPLDLVSLAIAAASALFGAAVGAPVGVYAVIVLAAVGGATWSANQRGESSRGSTTVHIALRVLAALVFTVPLAEALAHFTGLELRWTLAPLSALISARPDWIVGQLRALWAKRSGVGEQQP